MFSLHPFPYLYIFESIHGKQEHIKPDAMQKNIDATMLKLKNPMLPIPKYAMYYKKFFLFTNYFIMPKKIVMYNRKGVQGTKEEKQETQSSNVNSIIKAIITTNYTR